MTARTTLTLTIACLAAAPCGAGTFVTFRPQATVVGTVVTLGDVADVRGDDPTVANRLKGLIVAPAPATGRQARIGFDAVRARLAACGTDLDGIEFGGAAETVVTTPTAARASQSPRPRPIVGPTRSAGPTAATRDRAVEAVVAVVRRFLAARSAALASTDVEVDVPPAEVAAVASAASRGFEVAGGSAPWTGRQTFTLRFLDESGAVRDVSVVCRVQPRQVILATAAALPQGHVVRAEDLVWRTARESEVAAVTDPAAILHKEVVRPLRADQPVSAEAVKSVPLVRSGQFVTVTSRQPGIAVQRVMKARADGAADEIIPVVTLEDRRTLTARVTGLQEAEVVVLDPPGRTTAGKGIRSVTPEPATVTEAESTPVPMADPSPVDPADGPRLLANPGMALSVPAPE